MFLYYNYACLYDCYIKRRENCCENLHILDPFDLFEKKNQNICSFNEFIVHPLSKILFFFLAKIDCSSYSS